MVFRGPHLRLAVQFVDGPGGRGAADEMGGKREVFPFADAPPLEAEQFKVQIAMFVGPLTETNVKSISLNAKKKKRG